MTTRKYIPQTFIILCVLFSIGCHSTSPNVTYIEAQPLPESKSADPAVVGIAKPLPLPGQLKLHPEAEQENKKQPPKKTWQVIEAANRAAAQKPQDASYFNAMMQYDYAPGALYQVYTAPLKLTDIQLQPGEEIMGQPAGGDTVRWVMALGKSRVNGQERQHVYIKPTKPGLETTLSINTNRRTYHIELHSYKKTYMTAVSWRYPHDEMLQLRSHILSERAEKKRITATGVHIDQIHSRYQIKVINGKPHWTPLTVFDDGQKTFIEFPATMLNREAPALFILSADNETQLVNYRVRNHYYIVDRLFERAELRVGQQEQDIVRITRQSKQSPRFGMKTRRYHK